MKRLIDQTPGCLSGRGDAFQTLARSIVGQQISVKAAQSVWTRFSTVAKTVEPTRVVRMRITTMRNAGLSERKAEYIRDLAAHFADGRLDPQRWHTMSDEAIIDALVEVRGIGRWTAEMFLMFNLQRPNVLPLDDLGLLKAIGVHYGPGNKADRAQASAVAKAWHPWCTAATWYCWRSLDPVPVEV
jgi:DNA-3-methyladenine glycosylase II